MRVMLDTNVLASAVATRGQCADVLRAVLAEHELAICPQIIAELQRVLKDRFALPRHLINDFIRLVREDTILCKPGDPPVIQLKAKDDIGILSAAVSSEVNVLVAGDSELQIVGKIAELKLMSQREFWEEKILETLQIESYSFNLQVFIQRKLHARIRRLLQDFPAVAILGPRQCGKTTLALAIAKETGSSIYVDLERPSDARKLRDPELYFRQYQDRLICLDEIQRQPDLFPLLRGVIDEHQRNGRFLILGSVSRDLIRQSSETLAGRIAYLELTPFLLSEAAGHSPTDPFAEQTLWMRGGFPDSYLGRDTAASLEWRENFIRTVLERDIPQLGFNIPAETLRRLWRMLAHSHGQQLNSSRLGEAIGVSHTTIRSYLDLLSQTFMIRVIDCECPVGVWPR